MSRFQSVLHVLVAVLVGAALFGTASQAQASFSISVQTDSQTFTADDTGSPGVIDFFLPSSLGSLEIFATRTLGQQLTKLDVMLFGTIKATSSLVVTTTLTDIPTAPAPQTLKASLTGTPGGTTATMETLIPAAAPPLDTGTIALGGVHSFSFSAAPPYTLVTTISVSNIPTGGASLNLDGNNSITPAPAPAGLMLALTGLPVWGLRSWLRRRQPTTAG